MIDKIIHCYKTRRAFLKTAAMAAASAAIASQVWIAVRYLMSATSREARRQWKIGTPDQFDTGITSVEKAKIFLFRDGNRFKALSAVCTHLGCTLKRIQETHETASGAISVTEFHCPCHGSKFNASGEKIAGPARKPLQYVQITYSRDDKQLLIDNSVSVEPDFFLEIL